MFVELVAENYAFSCDQGCVDRSEMGDAMKSDGLTRGFVFSLSLDRALPCFNLYAYKRRLGSVGLLRHALPVSVYAGIRYWTRRGSRRDAWTLTLKIALV